MRSNINLKGLPWTCILQRNVVSSLICLGDALLSFSEGTSDWNENIQVRFHIWVRWLFHLKSWNWSLSPFVLLELVKLHKHFTKNDIFHLMNKSLICLRSLNLLFLGALILQNLSASKKKNPLNLPAALQDWHSTSLHLEKIRRGLALQFEESTTALTWCTSKCLNATDKITFSFWSICAQALRPFFTHKYKASTYFTVAHTSQAKPKGKNVTAWPPLLLCLSANGKKPTTQICLVVCHKRWDLLLPQRETCH